MRVSVVIPTRNERAAIAHVLADLPAELVTEVIVVDNNSTDGTTEIAAGMGARRADRRGLAGPHGGYGRGAGSLARQAGSPCGTGRKLTEDKVREREALIWKTLAKHQEGLYVAEPSQLAGLTRPCSTRRCPPCPACAGC